LSAWAIGPPSWSYTADVVPGRTDDGVRPTPVRKATVPSPLAHTATVKLVE